MPSLNELRFRANPHVGLRRLADLAAEQREPFLELESDPDFYGLLVPMAPLSMNLKSASRQTADLFQTLTSPARVDNALLADDEYARDLVDLVLDGILEIEGDDGFVSGADAMHVVCPSEQSELATGLSRDALLHAQDLETAESQQLTMALYLYNRIPISTFWKTRFPNREAVLAHLGADRGSLQVLLESHFVASGSHSAWLSWTSKEAGPHDPEEVTYKLYVSPRPAQIRDAFEVVVRVMASFPGTQFKIGDGAAGLLRPDKFVVYFTTREELTAAAEMMRRELAGCDAHGIPFTAALDDSGLLSWGIDPPDNDRALRWLGRDSWRYWLVQRLGAALSIAKSARTQSAMEPWRFAIERVRRQGVDVDTWAPSATLWSTP